MEISSDTLTHYGVKGMRWGVRRERGPDGRVQSEDSKKAEEHLTVVRSSSVKALSNKDLKELNARLQLEKTYKDLTDPSKQKNGKNFVKKQLQDIGLEVSKNIIKAKLTKDIKKAFKMAPDEKKKGD
jgi:hypothetical protein